MGHDFLETINDVNEYIEFKKTDRERAKILYMVKEKLNNILDDVKNNIKDRDIEDELQNELVNIKEILSNNTKTKERSDSLIEYLASKRSQYKSDQTNLVIKWLYDELEYSFRN